MKVGDLYEHTFSFTQEEVNQFAKVSGDNNPIHLDEEYAARTIFKRRIIHGFLGGSIFSKVFGTLFPGDGTIYLNQSLVFKRPMYTNTEYVAEFVILEINTGKNRAKVSTKILDNSSKEIIVGEALIQNKRAIF